MWIVQGVLEAIQPVVAQLGVHQFAQGIIWIQNPAWHQGRERGDQGTGRDGFVKVEIRFTLEALVAPVLFFRRLGADQHDLQAIHIRALTDVGAEGIAFVLAHFHADDHRSKGPALEPGHDSIRG